MVAAAMGGRRTGPGIKRGWTPTPVRAAHRLAQMAAARRVREAERVEIFWDLVEHYALTLEQLTPTRRRSLLAQAHEIQKWCDAEAAWRAREKSTTDDGPAGATVDKASRPGSRDGVQAAPEGAVAARAPALRGPARGW
jgi:hypothetical protein